MIWTIASNYCDYPSHRELSWQMKFIKRNHHDINHQPSSTLVYPGAIGCEEAMAQERRDMSNIPDSRWLGLETVVFSG